MTVQMAFTFDPSADYYELFELCMADGTTEALNDPQDFDEFLQALKDGRYDPETRSITRPTFDYYRFQADGKSYVCETEEEFFQAFNTQYDCIEGVVVDKSNCVVANFYWSDCEFEPTLTYLSNGEDFDNYVSSMDGGTGHFVYEYFEVIRDGEVLKRVEGINPEEPYALTKNFADALEEADAPQTESISPAPLTEEQKDKLLKDIAETCQVNTGWFSDHDACAYWFALTGEFHEDTDRMLGEFAEYITDDVVGRTIEASEYLPVAKRYCREEAESWLKSETPKERADFFHWSKQRFWEKGWSHTDATAAFGKNNPDWKVALWEWYSNNEEERIDFLYEMFDSTQLLVLFSKEITDNAVSLSTVLTDAGDDVSAYDEVVAQLFIRGGAIDGKVISDAAFLKLVAAKEEQQQKAIEEGKRRYAEQQAKIKQDAAAAAKERKEMKAARNLEDIFNDAMNDCNFDEVFSDADDFREMIEANIEEIASNFVEENEFCPTGNEPDWLVPALLKAGAEVG